MILIYVIVATWVLTLIVLCEVGPKIHPISSPGFIKVTTFNRSLCERYIQVIHPVTKQIMSFKREFLTDCLPVNL